MRLAPVLAAATLACAGARAPGLLPVGLDADAARATLTRFASALERSRWDEARELLSARWRAGYTPGRLALDFGGAGPTAREAAGRVLSALDSGARLDVGRGLARLPLGPGRTAVLVAEGGAWRVDALE